MIYFFLWEQGEEKLKYFTDNTNKMHPAIKFTAEWSKTSIDFLYVPVSITKGIIETDLYVKPTDSHQYLLASSCHSLYCKKSIPYSQALSLNRICSNNEFFMTKGAMTLKNIYWKEATVRNWYVRKYFELELFLEMHF